MRAPLRAMFAIASFGLGWAATAQGQQIRFLEGHTEPIYAVAYSPDGKLIATGSFDKTVRLWDRATGQTIRTYADHTNLVLTLAISPDGTQLATGGLDNTARLYDMPLRSPVADFGAQPADVLCSAISPDGKLLVTGDMNKNVKLWNLETNQPVRDFPGSTGEVIAVAFSPDAGQIIAAAGDGTIRGWITADAKPTGLISTPVVKSLAMLPDNKSLVTAAADGVLRVYAWPPALPKPLAAAPAPLQAVAFSADNLLIAAASDDGQVRIHNAADGAAARAVNHANGPVRSVGISRDNQFVVTGGNDGVIKVWKAADATLVGEVKAHAAAVRDVAFHPGNPWLATAGEDGIVRIWQLPLQPVRETAPHAAPIRALSVNTDASLIATASDDKAVKIIKTADGVEQRALAGHEGQVWAASFGANGAQIVTGSEDKKVRLYNVADGALVKAIEGHAAAVKAVALRADNAQIASGSADNVIKVWKADGTAERDLAGHTGPITALEYLPNNQLVSAGDSRVIFWNTADGAKIREVNAGQAVLGVAPSRDGALVAAACADNRVRVYKSADGALALTFEKHMGGVNTVRFSADNKRIISAGADKTVRIWDATTGAELQASPLPAGPTGVAFFGENKQAIVATDDGKLRTLNAAAIGVIAPGPGAVTSLTFNGAAHIVTGGMDKSVRLWNITNPVDIKQERAFEGSTADITDVAVSPNAQLVAASTSDGFTRVWQVADAKNTVTVQNAAAAARSVLFSLDNTRLITGGDDKLVRVIDLATSVVVEQFGGATQPVRSIALSGDGKQIAIVSAEPAGQIVAPAGLRAALVHKGPVGDMAISVDGGQIFTCGEDQLIASWNAGNLQQIRKFEGATGPIRALARSANNQFLIAGGDAKQLKLWNAASGQPLATLDLPEPIMKLQISTDGVRMIVQGPSQALRGYTQVQVQALTQLTATQEWLGHTAAVTSISLSTDGATLVTSARDKTIKRWKVAAPAAKFTLTGHTAHLYDIAFTPDSKRLATASADKTIKLWTAIDGKNYASCAGHASQVYGVAFHPTQNLLASAGADKTIRLWNPDDGKQTVEVKNKIDDSLYSICFSPNGATILAAGLSKTWQTWAVPPADPVLTISGHTDHIYRARFNPAGNKVLTIGYGGHVIVWDASNGNKLHNQQVPVRAAYAAAYAPESEEVALGTADNRLLILTLPGHAR